MTAVGFEPTPLRTGALSQRLRPLGQTVLASGNSAVVFVHVPMSAVQALSAATCDSSSMSTTRRRQKQTARGSRRTRGCRQTNNIADAHWRDTAVAVVTPPRLRHAPPASFFGPLACQH